MAPEEAAVLDTKIELKKIDMSGSAVLILIICFKLSVKNSAFLQECHARTVDCYSKPITYITQKAAWPLSDIGLWRQFIRLCAASSRVIKSFILLFLLIQQYSPRPVYKLQCVKLMELLLSVLHAGNQTAKPAMRGQPNHILWKAAWFITIFAKALLTFAG